MGRRMRTQWMPGAISMLWPSSGRVSPKGYSRLRPGLGGASAWLTKKRLPKNSGQRTMRTAGLTRQPTLPLRGVWKMEQIPGCSSVKGRKTVQQFIAAFRYGSLQTLHCRQDVAGEEMRKRNAFFHECPVVLEFGGRFCRAQPKEMC